MLLLAGMLATSHQQATRARALLRRALAAGADSGRVYAALAQLHARDSSWSDAILDVRSSLRTIHNTFRSPFPRDLLSPVLWELARQGPTAAVDSLLVEVVSLRPGWASLYELRAVVALRDGGCDTAGEQFLVLRQFGMQRGDDRRLIQQCRRGRS